jgi:hypothetical protein
MPGQMVIMYFSFDYNGKVAPASFTPTFKFKDMSGNEMIDFKMLVNTD